MNVLVNFLIRELEIKNLEDHLLWNIKGRMADTQRVNVY